MYQILQYLFIATLFVKMSRVNKAYERYESYLLPFLKIILNYFRSHTSKHVKRVIASPIRYKL